MPRPKNHAANVTASVEELLRAVTGLVGSIHVAFTDREEVRAYAAEVKKDAKDVTAAAKAKSAKLKKALKAYWKRMKGKAREQRVAVMLEGRGLKAKSR